MINLFRTCFFREEFGIFALRYTRKYAAVLLFYQKEVGCSERTSTALFCLKRCTH